VGVNTIKIIMDAGHDTLEKIQKLSENDLQKIKGVGPQKAKSLYDGLKSNKLLIQKIINNGISIKEKVIGKLTGKTFCFTGSANLPRKVLESKVTENGGLVKSSVNKELGYLVTNDTDLTSSKAVSAKKFGVKIITEELFLNML
jgi:DNA ligase (NAD+)